MKNCKIFFIIILSVFICAFMIQPNVTNAQGDTVKIGVNLGMTGFMALDSITSVNGFNVKLDEVGWEVNGKKIELIIEDNGSDVVKAVDKARKLVEHDKVDVVIGPIFSPAAFAVMKYLKESGTPNISIFGHGSEALELGGGVLFNPLGMHLMQGHLLGSYLGDKTNYKTASVIHLDLSSGETITNGVIKAFEARGGKMIQRQRVPPGTMDYSSFVLNIKKTDCVIFWDFGNTIAAFLKQYYDFGHKMPLVLPMGSVLQEPIMADIGDDVLGMIGSEHYVPLIENDLNTRFVSAYHKKYGEYPMTNSYGAWLAVTLFLEAVNATGGDTSHQKIIDALTKIKVDSPAGAYSLQREKNAFVGKGNLYIAKIVKIGDRYAWKPIHQYKDVLFNVP